MANGERESVWRLRDMKYKITALYHDVNQDGVTKVKHLDDLKMRIDELKSVQYFMENEISEQNDPKESRLLMKRAQEIFKTEPSSKNYRAMERAQLAYQQAFMARLESRS